MADCDTGAPSNSSWFASALDANMDSVTESPEEPSQDEDEDENTAVEEQGEKE